MIAERAEGRTVISSRMMPFGENALAPAAKRVTNTTPDQKGPAKNIALPCAIPGAGDWPLKQAREHNERPFVEPRVCAGDIRCVRN
jgi:hypothetical protein